MSNYKLLIINGKAIKSVGNDLVAADPDPSDKSQHFVQLPSGAWQSKLNGNVFDVYNTATSANSKVGLWPAKSSGNDNQLWITASDGFVQGKQSGLYLGFNGGNLVITDKSATFPVIFQDAPKDVSVEISNATSGEVSISYKRPNGEKVLLGKVPAGSPPVKIDTSDGTELIFEATGLTLDPSTVKATDGSKTTIREKVTPPPVKQATLVNNSGATIKVTVRTRVSPTHVIINEFTIPPGGSETVTLDGASTLEAISLDPSITITPTSRAISPGDSVVFTGKKPGVTLKNSSGVTVNVTYRTPPSGNAITISVPPGATSEVDILAGTTLTAVSSPAGTAISPSSKTIDGPQTVEFTNNTSRALTWDKDYTPSNFKPFTFAEGDRLATSYNSPPNPTWYCSVRSIPIPYSPGQKYDFEIEHNGSEFIAVGGALFTPVSDDWTARGISLQVPAGAFKVRITIDLAASPRKVTFSANGAVITPDGTGTGVDPNDARDYPLRVYVALRVTGSYARINPL